MSKEYKFKLTAETRINAFGVKLFRIEATCDIKSRNVKKGDKGGWLDTKEVSGNARVSGDAWVSGNAQVYGNARVYGNAQVSGNAQVYGNARVSGNAQVYGNARVYGNALDTGYCFAYKGNDWDVTEVPTKDGEGVLLVKDYKEPEQDEKLETPPKEIEINNAKYRLVE